MTQREATTSGKERQLVFPDSKIRQLNIFILIYFLKKQFSYLMLLFEECTTVLENKPIAKMSTKWYFFVNVRHLFAVDYAVPFFFYMAQSYITF